MNRRYTGRVMLVLLTALVAAGSVHAEEPLPAAMADSGTLVVINGERLTTDTFLRELGAMHGQAAEADIARTRQRPAEFLDRLINIRLILQEARNMGLDELPEIRKAVESYRQDAVKQQLFRMQTRDITVDPEEIDAEMRNEVQEFRVRSIVVETAEEASALEAAWRAGGDFEEATRELIASGRAEAGDETEFMNSSKFLPHVREVLANLQVGEISAPVEIEEQRALLQLLEIRYPDDPRTRRRLEADALRNKRLLALQKYTETLKSRHFKLDEELLEALDFEAPEPGFDALRDDERVLATIEGDEPIRVMDLTRSLEKQFFHGIENAIQEKKINSRKHPMLEKLTIRRLVRMEAKRLELDRSEGLLRIVAEFENGKLFEAFVARIVNPEVRFTEKDMQAYLDEHAAEFSSPEMMRIDGLAFETQEDAEAAAARLREGVDFRWLGENASGRTEGSLVFPATPLMMSGLPDEVREAVANPVAGDIRVCSGSDAAFYVLRIRDIIKPVPQPLEAVQDEIAKRVYAQKRTELLDDWIAKLRTASEVEVLATPEELERLLGAPSSTGA